jgi:uncharacterized damage-inducible protein DinB
MGVYGSKQLAAAFRTVRNNTIRIAEDIPEQQYGFIAAAGMKSVGQILVHIALNPRITYDIHGEKRLTTLVGYDFQVIIRRNNAEEQVPRTKAEIVDLLRSEGDQIASWLESLSDDFLNEMVASGISPEPRSRFESMLSIKEHEMHHRGQLMLIERQLGIVPHLTRAMAERAAAAQRQRETATATA